MIIPAADFEQPKAEHSIPFCMTIFVSAFLNRSHSAVCCFLSMWAAFWFIKLGPIWYERQLNSLSASFDEDDNRAILTRCGELVSEPDHFSFTAHFLKKYLTNFKNFSIFGKLVLPSSQFYSFSFWKKEKFTTLFSLFNLFRQSKSRKQSRKYDSAY